MWRKPWLRKTATVIGALMALIGAAGLGEDLETWQRWLASAGNAVGGNLGRWLLVIAGIGLVVLANGDRLVARFSRAPSPQEPAGNQPQALDGGWGELESERIKRYEKRRGLFLIHTWRPSHSPRQVADVTIRLHQHRDGPLSQGKVKGVEYVLGPQFEDHARVITRPDDGFKLEESLYGPMLCLARVSFTDGTLPVLLERYINFDSSQEESGAEPHVVGQIIEGPDFDCVPGMRIESGEIVLTLANPKRLDLPIISCAVGDYDDQAFIQQLTRPFPDPTATSVGPPRTELRFPAGFPGAFIRPGVYYYAGWFEGPRPGDGRELARYRFVVAQ